MARLAQHQRALEHYFLSPSMPEAVIPLNRLAQVMPMVGAFDRATPPAQTGFTHFVGQGVLHILG